MNLQAVINLNADDDGASPTTEHIKHYFRQDLDFKLTKCDLLQDEP
jgi:hypothetical protein